MDLLILFCCIYLMGFIAFIFLNLFYLFYLFYMCFYFIYFIYFLDFIYFISYIFIIFSLIIYFTSVIYLISSSVIFLCNTILVDGVSSYVVSLPVAVPPSPINIFSQIRDLWPDLVLFRIVLRTFFFSFFSFFFSSQMQVIPKRFNNPMHEEKLLHVCIGSMQSLFICCKLIRNLCFQF